MKNLFDNKAIKNVYVAVSWPDTQDLSEETWFDECILINDDTGIEMFGSSAYFVPIDRYKELKKL